MNEQISQNQPNLQTNYPQNIPPQVQPKNNMIMVVVVGVLMLIIGVLGGMLISSNKPVITQNITPSIAPSQIDQPRISVSITAPPSRQINIDKPGAGVAYLGLENNKQGIFFSADGAMTGYFVYQGGGANTAANFKSIKNISELLNTKKYSSLEPESIQDFRFNSDKTEIYLSVNYVDRSKNQDIRTTIYKINVNNPDAAVELWARYMADNTYPQHGPALISEIIDNHLVVFLGICYACEGFDPHGTVIINTNTKASKYIGTAANIKINTSANKVNYQLLQATQESCIDGPGCDNGKTTVYKPGGNELSDILP